MLDRAAVGLDCRDCGHRPHGADARPGIDVRCGEIVAASWSGSGPEPEHCECLDFGEVYKAHPSARETFLCGRCDRSFPSREALTQHETQVDCQRVPTRPPLERAPFVLPGSPVGQIAGLGE